MAKKMASAYISGQMVIPTLDNSKMIREKGTENKKDKIIYTKVCIKLVNEMASD